MKIISKFKDFYDYMAPDYDADIIYVRKPTVITDDKLCDEIDSIIDNSELSYVNAERPSWYDNGSFIVITSAIFGIYPFVFRVPLIIVSGECYVVGKELYEKMLKTDDMEELIKSYLIANGSNVNLRNYTIYYKGGIRNSLPMLLKKADCPEAFFKIGAPVFVRLSTRYGSTILNYVIPRNHVYRNLLSGGFVRYITNISFNRLAINLISVFADEIYNVNTCINIENFLCAMKQEPISEPDNKTKIEMHGFDIKTSFRKL